jgi:2'-5' RNA ligase
MLFICAGINLEKAQNAKKPVIFLGGDCKDNQWRKDLIKKYGDKAEFLDPYDPDWDPLDNTYDELAGMMVADIVVFYRGGKQTKKEKEFLETLGHEDKYRSFKDLNDVDKYISEQLKPLRPMRKSASDLMRMVVAKMGVTYDSSSTQVNLPEDLAKSVIEWGKEYVPEEALYKDDDGGKGREDDIHATLLYGITGDAPEPVVALLKTVDPFEVRLGLVTCFKDNPKYDVLKIDAESPELHQLSYMVRENVPNVNKFPSYAPHITIGYVQKGSCDELIGCPAFQGKTFKVNSVMFSDTNNKRTELFLGGSEIS